MNNDGGAFVKSIFGDGGFSFRRVVTSGQRGRRRVRPKRGSESQRGS